MINYFDVIKAQSGIPVDDYWAMLWAQGMAGEKWQITTLTGTLPLSFLSKGEALTDYRIYGTASGAGVETENLWDNDDFWDNGHVFEKNPVLFGYAYTVLPGDYTISTDVIDNIDASIASVFTVAATPNKDPVILSSSNGVFVNRPRTVTVRENQALWIIIRVAVFPSQDYLIWNKETFSNYWIMLVPGSTAPYGYKLPLTVESGAQSQDIPIYIGSSKLGEEEYVDYGEQKVYKRTENLFDKSTAILGKEISGNIIVDNADWAITPLIPVEPQSYYRTLSFGVACLEYMSENDNNPTRTATAFRYPTLSTTHFIRLNLAISNLTTATIVSGSTPPETYIPYLQPTAPPLPFPDISTYQGENTLSSEETVGEVSVTGKIKELNQ